MPINKGCGHQEANSRAVGTALAGFLDQTNETKATTQPSSSQALTGL